jgi:GDPmannose 4,6-dehydratase
MCRIAFDHIGMSMDAHLLIDPELFRPAEVDMLLGNAAKAKAKLGWEATITLEQMIREMVDADLKRLS